MLSMLQRLEGTSGVLARTCTVLDSLSIVL